VSGYGYDPALALLSFGFLPLPSNDAFYSNTFQQSFRCTRLHLPFGSARFYNFPDEVSLASFIVTEVSIQVS